MNDRSISLKITGPAVEDGHVPLLVLADKLSALQNTLYSLGASKRRGGTRGKWSRLVRASCELRLVDARFGSLEIEASLPAPEMFDVKGVELGRDSIALLATVLGSIASRDSATVSDSLPDYPSRARAMKSLAKVLPGPDDDYEIEAIIGDRTVPWVLRPIDREFVHSLSIEPQEEFEEESVRTIIGKLFRIEIDTSRQHVGVDVQGRLINCRYPDALEQTVSQLVAGSLVELTGRVLLDSNGNISEVSEVFDVEEIDLLPVSMRRIRARERTMKLRNTISVALDYQAGVWTYEYVPLGVLAYSRTRSEALSNFREELFAIWDDIICERDDMLSEDAIALKRLAQEVIENADGVA
ncbi:hypothetical protein HZB60_03540 [candidate division KSB1 bacterium]|nr:hypothetical protein [candidate division KSB1 bacterium]